MCNLTWLPLSYITLEKLLSFLISNIILLFLAINEFSSVSSKNKKRKQDVDLPGEILKKEGKEDCDALILEKALESENTSFASQNQSTNNESNNEEKSEVGKHEFFVIYALHPVLL